MKRSFSICLLSLFSVSVIYAQQTIFKHVVEPGETLSDIAKMYGTSEAELQSLNVDARSALYIGMELVLPKSLATSRNVAVVDCANADKLLSTGDYGKAISSYSKVMKLYEKTGYSPVKALYGRGLAYYNEGRWKKAISDLEEALFDKDSPQYIVEHSKAVLTDARKKRQEQIEARNDLLRNLLATAVAAAADVYVASQQSNYLETNDYGDNMTQVAKGKSALDIQIPESFNLQNYVDVMKPHYTFDTNGNPMVSYSGYAQQLKDMNTDVQKIVGETSSILASSNDSYYMAKAKSLSAEAITNDAFTNMFANFYSNPMYIGGDDSESDLKSDDGDWDEGYKDMGSETDNKLSSVNSAKNYHSETNGSNNSMKPSSRKISDDKLNKQTVDQNKKNDSHQQFKTGLVSSSDYKILKKNITLNHRDGDVSRAFLHGDLCKKGATYFIEIDNKYYQVNYSNWSRYNRSIDYGGSSAYFDL